MNSGLPTINEKSLLDKIIKKKTNKNLSFNELEDGDKLSVLLYIKNNRLDIKVNKKKWFDILTKCFYVENYALADNWKGFECQTIRFDTFGDLFDYCKGDIYSDSCFFGYVFSNVDKEKYSIVTELINYDSFLKESVDDYSFETLSNIKNEIENNLNNQLLSIVKFIDKCNITSYQQLIKEKNVFLSKFVFWDARNIFFDLLIRKYGQSIKDYIIKYICEQDESSGVSFATIIHYYGLDTAQKVIDNFVGIYSESTRKKRIKKFKNIISFFKEEPISIYRKSKFVKSVQMFLVRESYKNGNGLSFGYLELYFSSFDELVDYLDGDLSNTNFSDAPIDSEILKRYKIDSTTIFPSKSLLYSTYKITKKYQNGLFGVNQYWLDDSDSVIMSNKKEFLYIFDFIHFLKNDLSNADLLMCDGLENLKEFKSIIWNGAMIRSDAAKALGVVQPPLMLDSSHKLEYSNVRKSEIESVDVLNTTRADDTDYSSKISYITDLHLLHRFQNYCCETYSDVIFVLRKIIECISSESRDVCFVGGDVSSDYLFFRLFVKELKQNSPYKDFFFCLGNHELWPFNGKTISEIIDEYRNCLSDVGFHLVQNNIFYYANWKVNEITEQELASITIEELREKTRDASYIVFGGIGFSGNNPLFNANNGIYRDVLNRKEEIYETNKFYNLYKKVAEALFDKNVIVLTHMPVTDWSNDGIIDNFIYINGHNHRNYFFDDGLKRIYSDNQIGYRGKNISMKHISTNFGYDWFVDYSDGIYEITREDYVKFYRGIGETVTLNRDYEKLILIKRSKTYMFLLYAFNGKLYILNGGSIKSANCYTPDYFYDNLVNYAESVKCFLSEYETYQKNISSEIKAIGGSGTIHGSIIDIDFFNHLYVNPLDWSVTPYYALDITCKYVYKNIASLLKYQCPSFYKKYKEEIVKKENANRLLLVKKDSIITDKTIFVPELEIYRISRVLKGLQFTTKYNVVRLWNDVFTGKASKDNGELIVSNILYPDRASIMHTSNKKTVHKPQPKPNNEPISTFKEEDSKIAQQGKPVLRYSLKGKFIKEYKNVDDAELHTAISSEKIDLVCLRKLKQWGGYIWRYKENNDYSKQLSDDELIA